MATTKKDEVDSCHCCGTLNEGSLECERCKNSVCPGFTGIVTGVTKYVTGCVRYLVEQKVGTDGKLGEGVWFDDERLTVLEMGILSSAPLPGGG